MIIYISTQEISVVLAIHLLISKKKKKEEYFDLNYLFTVEIDSNHPEERERERERNGNRKYFDM
jgi:hypothetical protein